MLNSGTTINLKEDIFITITGNVPKGARRMITTSMDFMSENESKWYVQALGDKFTDYADTLRKKTIPQAKASLRSAVKKLIGNQDPENVKFHIYSMKN